jgi:hypothetical protein
VIASWLDAAMAVLWVRVTIHYLAITKRFKGSSPALMRDTKKMIAIGPATPMFAKSQIQVYSPSGEGLLLLGVRVDCSFGSCARF